MSLAQQMQLVVEHQLSPSQLFAQHKAQYESLKSVANLFEVAWEDGDAQSLSDIKQLMVNMMAELNATTYPTTLDNGKSQVSASKKTMQQEALMKLPLTGDDNALGPKAELAIGNIRLYLSMVEADILEHKKALEHK